MNAKRTEPRVHCWQRPAQGGYISAAGTTPDHLRAVFDAERARIAAKPRRGRKPRQPQQSAPAQLALVLCSEPTPQAVAELRTALIEHAPRAVLTADAQATGKHA